MRVSLRRELASKPSLADSLLRQEPGFEQLSLGTTLGTPLLQGCLTTPETPIMGDLILPPLFWYCHIF